MKMILLIMVIFPCFSTLYAIDRDTIVILPFSGVGVDESELKTVSEFVHTSLREKNIYAIVDQKRMIYMLKKNGIEDLYSCHDFECACLMGTILSQQYIVQGRIGKINNTYAIHMRILDVVQKEIVHDIEKYMTGSFLDVCTQTVPDLVQGIVETKLTKRKFHIRKNSYSATSYAHSPLNSLPPSPKSQKVPVKKKKVQPKVITMYQNNVSTQSSNKTKNSDDGCAKVFQLRREPIFNLTSGVVQKMIRQYQFHCEKSQYSTDWAHIKKSNFGKRFVPIPGDCTVVDVSTRLMWQREGSTMPYNYENIAHYVDSINAHNYRGFNDWRIPTLEEAMSLMIQENKDGVFLSNVFCKRQSTIWTCDKVSRDTSWVVRFDKGRCNYGTYYFSRYIRLVRSIKTLSSLQPVVHSAKTIEWEKKLLKVL